MAALGRQCIMQTHGCGSFCLLSTVVLKGLFVFLLAICWVNFCWSCLQWQCTVALKKIAPVPTSNLTCIPLLVLPSVTVHCWLFKGHLIFSPLLFLFLLVHTTLHFCAPHPPSYGSEWPPSLLPVCIAKPHPLCSHLMTLKKEAAHLSRALVPTYRIIWSFKAEDHNSNRSQGQWQHRAEKNVAHERQEVTGGCRQLHKRSTITRIYLQLLRRSNQLGLVLVACLGQMINAYKFWMESPKGTDHLENQGTDLKVIIKWNLKK
jgi:hypothetical protein